LGRFSHPHLREKRFMSNDTCCIAAFAPGAR